MESKKEELYLLFEDQMSALEGFQQGQELMTSAVKDAETFAKAIETYTRARNDDEKHELEMELLKKKDEREQKESETRIKQGWISAAGSFTCAVVSIIGMITINLAQAIDRNNGNFWGKPQTSMAKTVSDFMMRGIKTKRA